MGKKLITMSKQITYAVQQSRIPFDWNSFLDMSYKWFTIDKLDAALVLSSNWVTCGVGNQCAVIPRSHDGVPEDEVLATLGLQFNSHIAFMLTSFRKSINDFELNREDAKTCLIAIEQRAAFIIDNLYKENQDENQKV